ncbi:MAG: hypothetical protein RIQ99_1103, partial [Pseudomonadota bacterium]
MTADPSAAAAFFNALDRMVAQHQAAPATSPPPPRRIGAAGLALVQRFESCAKRRADGRFEAYPDPATRGAPWTIGWGATGAGIKRGTIWTQAACDARLAADLARAARAVTRALGSAPTSAAQFDALVSFQFNTGAIARAALTRLHKAGRFAL